MNKDNPKLRESNFELLRLIAMLFIVWYHLLCFFVVKIDDAPVYKAMYLPLHVAVICFVLISGYFRIRPSIRGIAKLAFPLLLFYLPLSVYELIFDGVGGAKSLFFFSKSPYWFIRTYFYLFLMAPVLNSFLASDKRRLYLLIVLGFMAVYMGWLMHDKSMLDGKNLVLFMFLYVLGDCLRSFREVTDRIPAYILTLSYSLLNIVLFVGYMKYCDSFIGKAIYKLSFPYCSPVLILNAVLLFVITGRLHFKSRAVNWLAGSVFAVYILHHQHLILYGLMQPCVLYTYHTIGTPWILILILGIMSLGFMVSFIMIDKLFSPVQTLFFQVISHGESFLKNRVKSYNVRICK